MSAGGVLQRQTTLEHHEHPAYLLLLAQVVTS